VIGIGRVDEDSTCVVAVQVQIGLVTLLVSSVTAAVRASARPSTVVPVSSVMDASAIIVPLNTVPVPKVAELPTCQKTLHALAPSIRIIELADAVVSVEPIWKMNTESGLPIPFRVTAPVISRADGAL